MDDNSEEFEFLNITEDYEFIYILYRKGDKKNVYKIGKTNRILKRFKEYPKGSIIHHVWRGKNCGYIETQIKNIFNDNFILDHGNEYFKGDLKTMIYLIDKIIKETDNAKENIDMTEFKKNYK